METNKLIDLSQGLKIAPEFIIRENWEMLVLKELSQSNINSALIFKGGTALRLAYNSPRFSDDLDFDLTKKLAYKPFEQTIKAIADKWTEANIKDIADKNYTYIAQIKINDPSLSRSLSIKLEISKRKIRKNDCYEPKLLTSPITPIQVLLNVVKLENIKNDKLNAIKDRRQPRDLFDLWYLSQLERAPWVCPEHSIGANTLKRELRKYLPKNYYKIIPLLEYEKSKPDRKIK